MPFISSSYDGSSSRRNSGSSISGLRGLDRFSSTRKSSVYERPSTYVSAGNSGTATNTASKYSSLDRLKNGNDSSHSYLSSTSTPSRFRSSENITNSSSSYGSTPVSSYSSSNRHELTSSPFGLTRRDRDSSASSYLRSESNNGNDYTSLSSSTSTYGGGNSNNSTLERPSYKPASRSNSSNLFNLDSNSSNTTGETNNNIEDSGSKSSRFSYPEASGSGSSFTSRKNSMADLNGIADMTKRIQETLARHGLDEKRYDSNTSSSSVVTSPRPAYNGRLSDNRYATSNRESRDREILNMPATPTGTWRRRHDSTSTTNDLYSSPTSPSSNPSQAPKWEIANANHTALKTIISRSTSPTPDVKRQLRTRIARTTDPIVVETRRSRKPRVVDASCQTEVTSEFGTLKDYLNPPPPPPLPPKIQDVEPAKDPTIISFDFFASVKKTLMETPTEKLYTALKSENSDSEEDYYEVKKAPMMQLLPGTRPLNSAIGN